MDVHVADVADDLERVDPARVLEATCSLSCAWSPRATGGERRAGA